MRSTSNSKLPSKKMYGLFFCISVLFMGAAWCGRGVPISYNQGFSLSSGQCQGSNTSPGAGEATLTIAVSAGPNITVCTLRASDGALLSHYDLSIHGDVVGHGDGLLFVNERGGDQGTSFALCAIHISDGLERWCQTRLTAITLATVSNGIIYASSSGQTLVAAVSERDGRVLWTFKTEADPAFSSSNSLPIVISNGAVYVSSYQSPRTGSPTPTDVGTDSASGIRNVCALGASNGRQLWCKSLNDQSIYSMAVDANALYVQTVNATIFAFSLVDGSILWMGLVRVSSSPYLLPHMLATHGMLFTNEPGANSDGSDQLYALRASDGQQLWHKPYSAKIGLMTVADQSLYVVTNAGELSVLNVFDGAPAWSHGGPVASDNSFCSNNACNIIVGHVVTYLLVSTSSYQNNARLLALRTRDGKTLWEDQACAPTTPAPAVASTGTPSPSLSPGNGRCYWVSRLIQGSLNVRLFLIDS